MKTLLLVRHAKSSWDDPAASDRQRPLNRRGMHDAPMMGRRLAEHGWRPELMLSSPATRAITTARIIAEQVGYPVNDIIVLEQLYAAPADELLKVIRGLDDGLQEVMLFAHNPGLSDLADLLTGGEVNQIPTCGVVAVRLDIKKWANVANAKPARIDFDFPKAKA